MRTMLLALLLTGCNAMCTPPGERITPEIWEEARGHALRLSNGGLQPNDLKIKIVHLPIEEIRSYTDKSPHACAYDRQGHTLYCRDDRPWQTDRGHHMGIVIHEATHSLQPDAVPSRLRESQAHAIQDAWMSERNLTSEAE